MDEPISKQSMPSILPLLWKVSCSWDITLVQMAQLLRGIFYCHTQNKTN